jgi:hypothetical protein
MGAVTAPPRPYARFRKALELRSVMQAEAAARELGRLGLLDALDLVALVATEEPARFERVARRWLTRLLDESHDLSLDDAQLALACLRSLPGGDIRSLRETLQALVKRRHVSRGL